MTESVNAVGLVPTTPDTPDSDDGKKPMLKIKTDAVIKPFDILTASVRPKTPPGDEESEPENSENSEMELKKVDNNCLNEIRDLYSAVRDDSKRLNNQLEQLEDLLENTFGVDLSHKEKEGKLT